MVEKSTHLWHKGTTFDLYSPVIQEKVNEFAESQEVTRGKGRIMFTDDEELLKEDK